jgi:hypothetical protein
MKTRKITEDQIKGIENGTINIKELFKDVFEVKIEVSKVYKNLKTLFLCTGFSENLKPYGYGFSCDNLFLEDSRKYTWGIDFVKEATTKEWKDALIKEAEMRGFKENVYVAGLGNTQDGRFHYSSDYKILYCGSFAVFNKGIWAEIIPTMTIKEAEEKLNCKIV